ncbi:MAG: TolC family protein [Armatimonadetes bacterium]|nr:TolC family protein [Armatimonadota bacterium]
MTLVISAFAAVIAASRAGIQTPPMTIDQAADLAVERAFAVRLAKTGVDKARWAVVERKSALGPTLSGSAQYLRFQKANIINLGGNPVVAQPIDQRTLSAAFSLPIDISGRIRTGADAARESLLSQQAQLDAQKLAVRLQARQAFLAVLRAQAGQKVAEQAVADATENLRIQQERLKAGDTARVFVIRAEAQLEAAKSDLITAGNNVALSKEFFNNVLAMPIETPVEFADITELPTLGESPEDAVKMASDSRPEVRSLERSLKSLDLLKRSEELALRPILALSLNYQTLLGQIGAFAQRQQVTGSLNLNWTVFDNGITRARVRQVDQDREALKIQLEQVKLGISLEVRQAWTNFMNAEARIKTTKKQVELAEENYRIATVRLKAGEGIQLEVTDAQLTLTQARIGFVNAKYDLLTANAELLRATGRDQVPSAPTNPSK